MKEQGVFESNSTPTASALNVLPVRNDLDFMDHFWLLVQSVPTKAVLKDCITAIIEELEQARLFPLV